MFKNETVVEKGNGRERKLKKNLAFSFFVLSELYRAKEKTEENKMESEKKEKYLEDTNSATYN